MSEISRAKGTVHMSSGGDVGYVEQGSAETGGTVQGCRQEGAAQDDIERDGSETGGNEHGGVEQRRVAYESSLMRVAYGGCGQRRRRRAKRVLNNSR
jgi:hypothetical protein